MTEHRPHQEMVKEQSELNERDSFTLRILGWFLVALAALTSLGFFSATKGIDQVLTLVAAGALSGVGLGMILWARRTGNA